MDATRIPDALRGGRADSALLQEYMPRFAARDYRPTGRIDTMVTDLNGALDVARLSHSSLPMTALCAEIHRMLTAAGLGDMDQAAVMGYFRGAGRAAR
ncbi:MAG: NAD-binding protein [Roseinatronobacter sp.]